MKLTSDLEEGAGEGSVVGASLDEAAHENAQ
jgi:hypothetical protein